MKLGVMSKPSTLYFKIWCLYPRLSVCCISSTFFASFTLGGWYGGQGHLLKHCRTGEWYAAPRDHPVAFVGLIISLSDHAGSTAWRRPLCPDFLLTGELTSFLHSCLLWQHDNICSSELMPIILSVVLVVPQMLSNIQMILICNVVRTAHSLHVYR